MADEIESAEPTERLERVVIIGGSIAGSLAAAALQDAFREMIIIDKDSLPEVPQQRKGVPQGHQYHALLGGGRAKMNELLPGFSEALVKYGAPSVSVTDEIAMRLRSGWTDRFESELVTVMASRPMIEWTVRKMAREIPNLEYRTGITATGFCITDGRADGVRIKDNVTGEESVLAADLVVDASGRSSKSADWLAELGFPKPSETSVNAKWGYASVFVEVPEGWDPGFRAMHCQPLGEGFPHEGPATRGCSMWEQEGERRWIFTVQGSAGDYPPRNEQELREFVSTIGVPEADEALKQFKFLSPIQIWRDTTSRRRDYAHLSRRPENFLLIGDAVAAFNPVYGQGMTVSALGGVTLKDEITKHRQAHGNDLTGLAESFQRRLHEAVEYCWASSTQQDFTIPGVEVMVDGEPQDAPAAQTEFNDRVMAYVTEKPDLYVKWLKTTHLLQSPEWLSSNDLVTAVKTEWDELGNRITTMSRELADVHA